MLTTIALRALVVLITFPGLSHFGIKHHKAAPRDTIPPVWKPASRLALEDRFVRLTMPPINSRPAALRVQPGLDPRRLVVEVEPDSGTIATGARLGDVPVGPEARTSLAQYSRQASRDAFALAWKQTSIQKLNSLGAQTKASGGIQRSGLSLQFPSPLPSRIQSLLGPGGPALNVSGSENISLAGTSTWTNQQIGLLGQSRSLFPSLDMQQNLDIRLEGQLSDRIKVNLLQNSANQVPLANRIAINYHGSEDDLIQEFDLGNTNLSLPGTQYVSYSGRNEGLFGLKSALRYGPLDVTMLASKQEGRSERATYAPNGAQPSSIVLYDQNYIQGVYFLLYEPNGTPRTIDLTSIKVFKDEASYGNVANRFRGAALPDPESSDTTAVHGRFKLLQPGPDQDYDVLNDLRDAHYPYLRLHTALSGDQILAVTYTYRYVNEGTTGTLHSVGEQNITVAAGDSTEHRLMLLRTPASLLRTDSLDTSVFDTNYDRSPLNRARELELRNFYSLNAVNIDPRTFSLKIEVGQTEPPQLTYTTPGGVTVQYLEMLGLDSRSQVDSTSASTVGQHDGTVDQSPISPNMRPFVDYTNGTLMFPDLRPFAPRLDAAHPFEKEADSLVSRRARLDGPPNTPNAPDPFYQKYVPRAEDAIYFLMVNYTAQHATGEIYLGRSNIVEGSETVTINGLALLRDKDYTIDYDLGKITLRRQLGPTDNLNIDYSYAPLFQQAGRTLVGGAFQLAGRDKSFGGAFLYESRGAQDLRPRLGEEPSRSLIADLNTNWAFKPQWMTRMIDALPGVRTTAPSDFNVQAEAGQSFPNPNTQNQVFVDDMEGARDAVSLSLDPGHWKLASVPLRKLGTQEAALTDTSFFPSLSNAEIHWYSPPSGVQERDLKPNLTDGQGAQNFHQTLCLSVPQVPQGGPFGPYPERHTHYAPGDSLWAGLTYVLDPTGLDLSRSQFIELWVNDWRDRGLNAVDSIPRVRGRHVRLHVDLGTVSEDEMLAPNEPPNGRFDTEDKNRDGVLQVTGDTQVQEDNGLDGVPDASEGPTAQDSLQWDLSTASGNDRHGDDFQGIQSGFNHDDPLDPRRYRFSNGTENNHTVMPIPDTEDLNGNQNLDTDNNYVEFTVDLGDPASPYLITDVYDAFHREGYANNGQPLGLDNGWRHYRIPLGDSTRVTFGNPNLAFARHARVWLEGMLTGDQGDPGVQDLNAALRDRPMIAIGDLEIVGSRWVLSNRTARGDSLGTRATINTVNTADNADIYRAPFDPGQTREGNQEVTRREQSLALEFDPLVPRDTVEAYRTFSLDEDYSRYGALDWWVTGFYRNSSSIPPSGTLSYFVRFASDEQGKNYYEYRAPLPAGIKGNIPWHEVHVQLTDLSNLKLEPRFPKLDPIYWEVVDSTTGVHRIVRGRPSFTRLRRISFGVINNDTTRTVSDGQAWLDEVRATDVARDVGRAGRFYANGHMANLLSYNSTFDYRDADFLTVGQTRGLGSATRAFTFGATMDVHRFFEGTGIILPVTFNGSWNDLAPRFNAGDDVVRTGAYQDASRSFNQTRSFSTQYSRAWGDRSSPFLRYTLGGITAAYTQSDALARNPTARSTSRSRGWAVNYGIQPRRLLVLGVPRTKFKFYPLPERVFWNYSIGLNTSRSWQRTVVSRDTVLNTPLTSVQTRTAGIDFGADTRPFDFIHHHIEGHRNLVLPSSIGRQDFLGLHVGRVTSWSQGADARFALNRGDWLRPTFSWSANYGQNNGPELSPDLGVRSISNGQQMTMSWELPFDRLGHARPAGYGSPGYGPSGSYPPPGGYPQGPRDTGGAPGSPYPGTSAPGSPYPGRGTPGTYTPGGTPGVPGGSPFPGSGGAPAPPGTTSPGTAPGGTMPGSGGAPVPGGGPAPGGATPGGGAPGAAQGVFPPAPGMPRDTTGAAPPVAAPPDTGARAPAPAVPDTTGFRPDTTRGAADTTRAGRPARPRPRFHFDLRDLIARIGSVGTDMNFSQNSAFSRVTGTPDFLYLFGLSSVPQGYGSARVLPGFGNTQVAGKDLRLGAHTRISLPFSITLQTRADFDARSNQTNGLVTRQRTHHYPYIEVDYGSLARLIQLDHFLKNPQLKTTFDRNQVLDYAAGSDSVTGISNSLELRPLLSIGGELKNQTRVDLRVDTRNTTHENRVLGNSTDVDQSVEGKLDLSRQYSQGQKVSFLGKETTVRSSITLGFSAVYSRSNRETRIAGGSSILPTRESRISVSANGSYGFSDNVFGNASIGFSQNRNIVSDIVTRSLRVELRAQFTF